MLVLRDLAMRLPDLFGSRDARMAQRFAQSELVEDAVFAVPPVVGV